MLVVKSIAFTLALVGSFASATESNLRSNVQAHQDRELFFWWGGCWWGCGSYTPPSCSNTYVCPANSYRIEGIQCYDGFEDCACNVGFLRNDHEKTCNPICTNSYVCPANSYRIANRDCYDAFDDCECFFGFARNDHEKTCNPICTNSYVCPANSFRIANRDCYDAFDDCACNQGFTRNDQDMTCTKPPTNAPVKPPTNAPVKPPVKAPRRPPATQPVNPPTVCTYVCPANSYKTNPTGCAIQFSQCTCNPGFSKLNGKCVKY